MEMADKPHRGDRQHILASSAPNHNEDLNQGEEFEWSNDPLPDDWKQYFLRRKCIALAGVVVILLIAVVALIASNHAGDEDSDIGRAQYAVANKPATFCKTPKEGELPGLSKEAFTYWTAVNPRPTHSQIIMLADGYGPEIHTMARSVKRYAKGDKSLKMALDPHLVGQSITSSSSNIITDSASGATAYSVGQKTYNGAIAVVPSTEPDNRKCADSDGGSYCPNAEGVKAPSPGRECCKVDPIAHVFEGCRAKGMATGLVVTTVLPHATPASWSAHANVRYDLEFIAQQQLEHDPPIDVILGGGRALFDYHRKDGRDLLAERAETHTIVSTAEELEAERVKWETEDHHATPLKPLIGLFADHDLQYEVDRQGYQGGREPHLKDMVEAALMRLEATGKKYCLLVEGSHIDTALHANDAGAAAHEALAYDEAVDAVMKHAHMRNRDDVSVVSVADHSTGGSTLGMQRDWNITYGQAVCQNPPKATGDGAEEAASTVCAARMGTYAYDSTDGWSPLVLSNAKSSIPRLAQKLCCEKQFRQNPSLRIPFIEDALQIKTGVDPKRPWADIEQGIDDAIKKLADDFDCMKDMHESVHGLDVGLACTVPAAHYLRTMQQFEARVGFTTNGHTSVDISVYAAGVDKLKYLGAHENSEIGEMMIQSLGLDLAPITQALKDCNVRTFPEPRQETPPE